MSEVMAWKVSLLIEQDFNIWERIGYDQNEKNEIEWNFQISRNVRAYRNVQTIENYIAANTKPKVSDTGGAGNPSSNPIVRANIDSSHDYDVAISFAGTERDIAEQLATIVQNAGYRVFYDKFYTPELWGTDLVVTLDEIYRKKARYCVMFFSSEYVARMWTNHERRSATARMVAERENEYLLPIMVEHVEVPGITPTISYLSLSEHSIPEIAAVLIAKLEKAQL